MVFSKKDAEIISHLRNNAREKVTMMSKKTGIPATTIYDKIRVHEKKFIKKNVALLNFSRLGLNAKSHLALSVERESKEALQKFLIENPHVNSLCKINFGYDFLAEIVFKNIAEVEKFVEDLESSYKMIKVHTFNVTEELKKEEFLTRPEHFGITDLQA